MSAKGFSKLPPPEDVKCPGEPNYGLEYTWNCSESGTWEGLQRPCYCHSLFLQHFT